jgi:hypothetical protein
MPPKLTPSQIAGMFKGLESAGQPMDKPHTQNLIQRLQKSGQHKEAGDIFRKAYKDNSPASRNSLARRLKIEPEPKPVKTKGSGSRSTTKFAYPRGGVGGIPTGGRSSTYPYKK